MDIGSFQGNASGGKVKDVVSQPCPGVTYFPLTIWPSSMPVTSRLKLLRALLRNSQQNPRVAFVKKANSANACWWVTWSRTQSEMKMRKMKGMPFSLLPRHRGLAAPSAGKLSPLHLPVRSIVMRCVSTRQLGCLLAGMQRRMSEFQGGGEGSVRQKNIAHSPGTHK